MCRGTVLLKSPDTVTVMIVEFLDGREHFFQNFNVNYACNFTTKEESNQSKTGNSAVNVNVLTMSKVCGLGNILTFETIQSFVTRDIDMVKVA